MEQVIFYILLRLCLNYYVLYNTVHFFVQKPILPFMESVEAVLGAKE